MYCCCWKFSTNIWNFRTNRNCWTTLRATWRSFCRIFFTVDRGVFSSHFTIPLYFLFGGWAQNENQFYVPRRERGAKIIRSQRPLLQIQKLDTAVFCCLIFWLAQSFRLIRILPVIAPPPISSYSFLQSPKKDSLPMFSKMLFSGLKIVQCFLASAWSSQRPSFAPLHEIPLNPPLANRRVQKKEQHEQKPNKQSKKTNK